MRKSLFSVKILLIFLIVVSGSQLWSQVIAHKVIRRIVVFPVHIEGYSEDQLMDAWWAVRKELTTDNFYFVASKNFLTQKNVYQARKSLTASDAVVLTKYLDAQVLMLFTVKNRLMTLKVYSSQRGDMIWSGDLKLFNYISVLKQIKSTALKLTKSFKSAIPYNSFVVFNSIKQKVVFKNKGKKFINIFIGGKLKPKIGANVQIFNLEYKNLNPLFMSGGRVNVVAEGKVRKLEEEVAQVELLRYLNLESIKENNTAKIIDFDDINGVFIGQGDIKNINLNEVVSFEKNNLSVKEKENQPFYTSLLFILGIFTFIVVGF